MLVEGKLRFVHKDGTRMSSRSSAPGHGSLALVERSSRARCWSYASRVRASRWRLCASPAYEVLRINQRGNRTIIQVIETPPTRGNPSFAKSFTGGENRRSATFKTVSHNRLFENIGENTRGGIPNVLKFPNVG
jgi:hypothetical protein